VLSGVRLAKAAEYHDMPSVKKGHISPVFSFCKEIAMGSEAATARITKRNSHSLEIGFCGNESKM
jgi:hypothetical protein